MTRFPKPWCMGFAALLLWGAPVLAQKPGDAAGREESAYRQLELFARVLSYVENNYVESVDRKTLVQGAIQGMLDTLDPHTLFMPPEVFREMKIDTSGEFGGLGIEIARKGDRLVVVAPIDDTPAARAGIKAGDELLAIDGESTQGMDLGRALQKMRGPAGGRVLLTLMRAGFNAPRELAILRDHIRIVSVESALYDGIGHVKVKNFQDRTDLSLKKELDRLRALNGGKELDGLVLDLRNNPGGLLDQAVAMSDRFLPGNLPIVSTRGRDGRNASEEKSRDRDTEKDYPLVVLVNAGSASASEIVAGALQDHGRAVIMGTQTFGKGSVQTIIELEDGSGLKLTIARYYTPKGRSIQEKGITPDFLVPEDSTGKPGTDAPREKDLRGHFKAEPSQTTSEVAAHPRTLPANLKDWAVTAKLADPQLKVALNYLHGLAPGPASRASGSTAGR
ncbi:S41 family peptidase [Corallococcus sp. AB032C]|uniref:S41 family peptidase n=1 Tax=Corallococcus TaxID=83461 RepID=UPI000EB91AC4|nr:S41 family peptidase [Corallococcus sp. AB032C]NNB90722.1 S41 family peptidase [Corallococcus exiguus]NPC52741.1 S41 family peptidase [Corallococcus exiguus]RKH75754.1 S41 family peptidase [Corallococcus sp. AB032C]